MRFDGKTVVVTGGTQGIGRAIAASFAREGAFVAVTGRDLAKSEAAAAGIAHEAGVAAERVKGLALDVSDAASCESGLAALAQWRAGVDVLVNNAGITRDMLLMRLSEEDWDAVLATNLTGAFRMCKALVRGMVKQKSGRIINVASVVGVMGNPGQTNYVASKAGLIGFTKALAKEVGSRNITVNAVAPGFIETAMTAELPAQAREAMLSQVPLGRTGSPADVASAILFLASADAAYITGQVLRVDGGMVTA